jgi:hypothetical protein
MSRKSMRKITIREDQDGASKKKGGEKNLKKAVDMI